MPNRGCGGCEKWKNRCQCATASASKKRSTKKIHGKKEEAAVENDRKGDVNEDAKAHANPDSGAVSKTSIEEASLKLSALRVQLEIERVSLQREELEHARSKKRQMQSRERRGN